MITLNLFDFNWWSSFREINVLKSVNKLFFQQNTKKWANLVYFYFFKGLQNLGKYFKPNFPIKVWRSNAFSQKLFILNAKKLKCYFFFESEEVHFTYFYIFAVNSEKGNTTFSDNVISYLRCSKNVMYDPGST